MLIFQNGERQGTESGNDVIAFNLKNLFTLNIKDLIPDGDVK
jgi:hypothetical protein